MATQTNVFADDFQAMLGGPWLLSPYRGGADGVRTLASATALLLFRIHHRERGARGSLNRTAVSDYSSIEPVVKTGARRDGRAYVPSESQWCRPDWLPVYFCSFDRS
jgi:hypothetical protein